jgi:hypothetical protein
MPFTPPEENGDGFFLKKSERDALKGTPLEVVAVEVREEPPGSEYPGTNQIVTFVVDDEERGWGFKLGSVISRDRLLTELEAYLADPDEDAPVFLEVYMKGKAQLIKVAETE